MADVKNKRVVIYIDQAAAEDALTRLQTKADGFNNKIKTVRSEQEKLLQKIKETGNAGGDITKLQTRYDELGRKVSAYNKDLTTTQAQQLKLKQQIDSGITPSFAQLERYVSRLRNELKQMSQDAPEYASKFDSYKKASQQLGNLKTAMNGVETAQRSWLKDVKTVAFGVLIGNTVQSMVQSIGSYFTGMVQGNAKLSDSFSDIEKSTGLSSQAVQQLNSELQKIDTRTKAADLREIAIGLGQIGEAANVANVQAIDKIVVALGDEFGGGAREITTSLSVLRNNLSDLKTGDYATDVSHIGNALNTLGAEGLATAPIVTEIANRIAGIGRTFGLTSGQILGTAATFQELGIETERGSTAIVKLFQKIGAEPEKFAKVAGISIKEFKTLVNSDMLGAFEAVAAGAKKAGSNNIIFSKILKELDADGSGAGEVLSKLGINHELLAKKVVTATEALKSQSSITDEFSKKNNNLAAELEKLDKKLLNLIQSQTITEFFTNLVRGFSSFIDVLKAAPKWIKDNQQGLYLLAAGVVLLNASYIKSGASIIKDSALKAYNTVVTTATSLAQAIATRAQMAYIIALDLVKGRLTLAAAAQQFYTYVMNASLGPIGIVLAIIGAAAIAYNAFTNRTKELTAAQIRANDELARGRKVQESWLGIQESANTAVAQTVTKLNYYKKAAEDVTKKDVERKKAIDSIIAINPKFFGDLDLEAVKTGKLSAMVNTYVEALTAAAQEKALFDKRVELEKQKLDLSQQKSSFNTPANSAIVADASVKQNFDLFAKKKREINTALANIEAQLAFLDKKSAELKLITKKVPDIEDANGGKVTTDLVGTAAERAKKLEAARKDYADLIKKITEELNKASKSEFTYAFDNIFENRKEQEKKLNDLFKTGAISKEQLAAGLALIYQETVAKLNELSKKTDKELKLDINVKPELIPDFTEAEVNDFMKLAQKGMQSTIDKFKADDRNMLAGLQLGVMNAKTRQEILDANLALLDEKMAQELLSTDKTENEKALIIKKYSDETEKLKKNKAQEDKDDFTSEIGKWIGYAQEGLNILSSFNQAKNNRENQQLALELRRLDEKKRKVDATAKAGVMTAQEYQIQIEAINREGDEKKRILEAKQFERNKKIQIAQTLMNAAAAAVKLWSDPGFPLNIPLYAILAGQTLAQLSIIKSQEPKFEKGGIAKGSRHADGGISMVDSRSGKKVGEMEAGEPYMILSRNTYRNNRGIVDSLLYSSMNQGGAPIRPAWQTRPYAGINYSAINLTGTNRKYLAQGGTFNSSGTNAVASIPTQVVIQSDPELKMLLNALIIKMDQPFISIISQKKIEEAASLKAKIISEATA